MQVTLSTGRTFNIEALTAVQSLEAVRLVRSTPKPQVGNYDSIATALRGQRNIINWALGNAGADPDVAEIITGRMRLDEMVEIIGHIQSLTLLANSVSSETIN